MFVFRLVVGYCYVCLLINILVFNKLLELRFWFWKYLNEGVGGRGVRLVCSDIDVVLSGGGELSIKFGNIYSVFFKRVFIVCKKNVYVYVNL